MKTITAGNSTNTEHAGYLIFDLSSIRDRIIGARLELDAGSWTLSCHGTTTDPNCPPAGVSLWKVDSTGDEVMREYLTAHPTNLDQPPYSIFADLQSDPLGPFAIRNVSLADNGTALGMTLNGYALETMNSVHGLFVLGVGIADTGFLPTFNMTAPAGSTPRLVVSTEDQAPPQPTLQTLAITGPARVGSETSERYVARATWSDGTVTTVTPTWSVTPGTWALIDSDGLLTAGRVLQDQVVQVQASLTSGGITRTATQQVVVTAAPRPLTGLRLEGPAEISEKQSGQFSARAVWSDSTETVISPEWSLAPTDFAVIGLTGLLTARDVATRQTVLVQASYSIGGVTATAFADVAIVPVPAVLQTLAITGPARIESGETVQYHAFAIWDDGTRTEVSPFWCVIPATYATIDSSGRLTAGQVERDQTVQVLASYTSRGVTRAACVTVTITAPPSPPAGVTPTLDIVPSSAVGQAGLGLTFRPVFTGMPTPSSIFWDFDDGSASLTVQTSAPVTHAYDQVGAYTMAAVAADSLGQALASDTAKVEIRTGRVEPAPVQADGSLVVTVLSETYAVVTPDDLRARYRIADATYVPLRPAGSFSSDVSRPGAAAVFRFAIFNLPGQINRLRLIDLRPDGTSEEYLYGSSALQGAEGSWWMTDQDGNDLPLSATLAADTIYQVLFVIMDNGRFDRDTNSGAIAATVSFGRSATAASPGAATAPASGGITGGTSGDSAAPAATSGGSGGGGGGGGCVYDAGTTLALELPATLLALAIIHARRRGNRRD